MQDFWYGEKSKLGVLGGGQLGRMMIQEAINWDVQVYCLDPDGEAPCHKIASGFTQGSLLDYDTVLAFGADKDVITVEIEHVNIEALAELERQGKRVFPQPRVLKMIQDKGLQKAFYREKGIPTADFSLVDGVTDLHSGKIAFPTVQKMRKGGYDGKGVQVLRSAAELQKAFDVPSVLEALIDFEKELSVIVARNEKGETAVFPVVECEFNGEANLVEFLFAPASVSDKIASDAQEIAKNLICSLDMVGLLAVEFFLDKAGNLLVNEIAPRPHNSGHHTIECNVTSQFEQHLRSILNLPLGSTDLLQAGVMINLLGEPEHEGIPIYKGLEQALSLPGVKPHIYGKRSTKAFRKMGHVTICNPDLEQAKTIGRTIQSLLKVYS